MNSKIFVFLAFVVVSLEGTPSSSPVTWLTSLGQVEGKEFFVNDQEISWAAAMGLCHKHNMKVATITTSAQVDHLDKQLTKLNAYSHYWTSGYLDILWSTTGEVYNNAALGPIDYYSGLECLAFRVPRAEYSTQFRTIPCTFIWPVICEA